MKKSTHNKSSLPEGRKIQVTLPENTDNVRHRIADFVTKIHGLSKGKSTELVNIIYAAYTSAEGWDATEKHKLDYIKERNIAAAFIEHGKLFLDSIEKWQAIYPTPRVDLIPIKKHIAIAKKIRKHDYPDTRAKGKPSNIKLNRILQNLADAYLFAFELIPTTAKDGGADRNDILREKYKSPFHKFCEGAWLTLYVSPINIPASTLNDSVKQWKKESASMPEKAAFIEQVKNQTKRGRKIS